MNSVVENMIHLNTSSWATEQQKLREVMQQIALAGLYRGGFFSKAAFYGGTCLRLFHGLPRFSEDLDFSLLESDAEFNLEDYFPSVVNEFAALGMSVTINKKTKSVSTAIESAFLKSDSDIYQVESNMSSVVKIKVEVDTEPPGCFQTENKVLLQPFSFMTRCYQLPDLYAGKMHVLLFRRWKNRVKGRDWYDFEWYVKNNISLHYAHFMERANQFNPEEAHFESIDDFLGFLHERIDETNFDLARKDIAPFIEDPSVLDIWSPEYFHELVRFMRLA